MSKTYAFEHPVFLKPIETVEELTQYVLSTNTTKDAPSLSQLIRDSFDAYAEKPPRRHIADLVKAYLVTIAPEPVAQQPNKDETILKVIDFVEANIVELRKSIVSKHDKLIQSSLNLLMNEIENLSTLLKQAA